MGVLVNLDVRCKVQDARCRMQRIMHRASWVRDRKGTVVVQALLILPILILIVFGGYTIWKVASVKQSLHSGTYQATRYLCLNPVASPYGSDWAEVANEIVKREVRNNGLIGGVSDPSVTVNVQCWNYDEDRLVCGGSFEVITAMRLQIGIPYLSMSLTLHDRHEGWVEC